MKLGASKAPSVSSWYPWQQTTTGIVVNETNTIHNNKRISGVNCMYHVEICINLKKHLHYMQMYLFTAAQNSF